MAQPPHHFFLLFLLVLLRGQSPHPWPIVRASLSGSVTTLRARQMIASCDRPAGASGRGSSAALALDALALSPDTCRLIDRIARVL
jgi:hypothetical protein